MLTSFQKFPPLTWAEIDLKAVTHNLKELRRLAARHLGCCARDTTGFSPGAAKTPVRKPELLTVIKADAYGHGAREIGRLLQAQGVRFFGVSDVAEGIDLRGAGITKPILLLETTLPALAPYLLEYDLIPTVNNLESASALNAAARQAKKCLRIHIKVDTGMGRLGVWHEESFDFIRRIQRFRYLTIHGIYTHFPSADTDKSFTRRQLSVFYELVQRLDRAGLVVPYIHAANSMGLAGYQTRILNLARPGLMLYGLYPNPALKKDVRLKPAMSVRSRIIFLKTVKKGRSVSYGRTFVARRDMTVATLPIGYNDGYLRDFSNRACVLVAGVRCPVIGRVTMDQIMVDVTHVAGSGASGKGRVRPGRPVILLGGPSGTVISADELARHASTINYEIVCLLGNRLPRLFKK